MAVAQHHRGNGGRPVRAGGGSDVAGADWWTGPASWRVGVGPVSRTAIRNSLAEGARESPPSLPKLCICHPFSVRGCCLYVSHAPHLFLKNLLTGGILQFCGFLPKRFSTLILVVFPLCLGPRFFLVRTFPEEDTHDRD